MTVLLPCPFCPTGGAQISRNDTYEDRHGLHGLAEIKCSNPSCLVRPNVYKTATLNRRLQRIEGTLNFTRDPFTEEEKTKIMVEALTVCSDAWNTRTPNKSAEVDLDALKLKLHAELTDVTAVDIRKVVDFLYSSGHLATGKGGGEPAAPTQIDAGELGSAVESLKAVLCDPEGKCCIPGSDADIKIIDDALSTLTHLSKLSGGE